MKREKPPVAAIMLLTTLLRRGVALRVQGGQVQWRPKVALSAEERQALEVHKTEVIALLAVHGGAVTPGATPLAARDRWTADPRDDLAEDRGLWRRLLTLAYDYDGDDPAGLFGSLHGLRCCGARLVVEGGQVRLVAGELDDAYPAFRERYLLPHAAALLELLGGLAEAA